MSTCPVRAIASALVLLAALAVGGCGSEELDDEAVNLGRARALADAAFAELQDADAALRATRPYELERLDNARPSVREAATEMDTVINGLHGDEVDEEPGEAARIGDASTRAAKASAAARRDGDAQATITLGVDAGPVSTRAHVAIIRAVDALGEASAASADAEDAVDDWLSSRTANDA